MGIQAIWMPENEFFVRGLSDWSVFSGDSAMRAQKPFRLGLLVCCPGLKASRTHILLGIWAAGRETCATRNFSGEPTETCIPARYLWLGSANVGTSMSSRMCSGMIA